MIVQLAKLQGLLTVLSQQSKNTETRGSQNLKGTIWHFGKCFIVLSVKELRVSSKSWTLFWVCSCPRKCPGFSAVFSLRANFDLVLVIVFWLKCGLVLLTKYHKILVDAIYSESGQLKLSRFRVWCRVVVSLGTVFKRQVFASNKHFVDVCSSFHMTTMRWRPWNCKCLKPGSRVESFRCSCKCGFF